MATQENAASVQGAAIRVTRLDAAGNLLTGPHDSYTMNSFMRVTFTPEYEEGDEITEKGADGTVCVTFKAPDTLKRLTMEIAICEPDPEFSALVGGGVLLTREGKSVGWATTQVGENPSGNGVAVEVWSYAVADGKKASTNPYFHWVFPYVTLRQSGDRVIENGLLANTFSGEGLGNLNFGEGPDGRWEWPTITNRPYSYARTDYAPIGVSGWTQWSNTTGVGTPITSLSDTGSGITLGQGGWGASGADYILDADDD
ncbi:MAG: hypothetical protein E6R04_00015 [Spirochaetes bacterium]|nr:MAG: hypothetical protein E6R04_00015 [Spirochaetota bacterium]